MSKCKAGELRPSQLLRSFGIGSIVDLPNISAMVMGLDDWQESFCELITENRLLLAVKAELSNSVKYLRSAPRGSESSSPTPFDEDYLRGVPVAPFPRWLLCPYCRLLAPIESNLFELKTDIYRPERTRYVHSNCRKRGKPPIAVPARFLVACKKGHLNDFPWIEFVHYGRKDCNGVLRLYELGASGEAADIHVKCDKCESARRMSEAFGEQGKRSLPKCEGRRPHLRDTDSEECPEEFSIAISLGASNSWFPIILSSLTIPSTRDKLMQLVEENWATLEAATSKEILIAFKQIGKLGAFVGYSDDEIWSAVEVKRTSNKDDNEEHVSGPEQIKISEWEVLSNPDEQIDMTDFLLKPVELPRGFEKYITRVVLVQRLREVQALIGFTRIESPNDFLEEQEELKKIMSPLSRRNPTWVPSLEVRGEGIFIQFDEEIINEWTNKNAVKEWEKQFFRAHCNWRRLRRLEDFRFGYPGIRYVFFHSFAHVLMRQFSLECGYTAASIRERIYSSDDSQAQPMAGILIYTATPDSEGTLGGLVSLGEPENLSRHIQQALSQIELCSSDPLCSERMPSGDGQALHAAACHACLFAPETSCERGNKYLDRSVLIPTLERNDIALFENYGV